MLFPGMSTTAVECIYMMSSAQNLGKGEPVLNFEKSGSGLNFKKCFRIMVHLFENLSANEHQLIVEHNGRNCVLLTQKLI